MNVQCPSRAIAQTDPVLFERVIRNVLNNAITHNQHCNLYVNLQQEQDQWHLTISDTGKGIAVEEQERVFEEFYQVHNPERDRRKGLGLGLSIVQRLSALLELGMDFESVPNAGTMFTFCIPAVSAPPSTLQSDDDPPIDLKPMHVLVVDDESAVRKSMTILLESMGHQVSIAEGTESAISLAPTLPSQPDIALIDYRLRGSDSGLITIGRLRELYPRLPAIFISGDTAPDRLRDAEQAGIQLLAKPVRKTELCAAMASADCS